MKTRTRSLTLATALVMAAAACDDGGTGPAAFDDASLRADLAIVAADGMFQDLAHMESTTFWAGTGFAPAAAGIELEGSKTFSRTVTFFDGSGVEQDSYDPFATASIHIVSSLTRTVSHTFWSADIQRDRDMSVTGLEGEETQRTWNGTGSSVVSRSRHPESGSERQYDMTSSAVIEGVVRGVPRSENPYPLDGTITRTIHVVRTVDGITEERDIVTVITFDGTQFATLTVDGDTFQVDLAERGLKKRFQRKNG